MQAKPLPKERVVSSIPRGKAPAEDDSKDDRWEYPSEQMFYNAMRRKGWAPTEDDMKNVVSIHNATNERTWREIEAWELERHPECKPRLLKFAGRPTELSPKARIFNLLGYRNPFDRHDWVIDR
jgi:cytochrome c heme-lyase